MPIIYFERGTKGNIQKNFTYKEFECHCGKCQSQPHDTELSEKLQKMRDILGVPIIITSPYRCPARNAATPGAASDSYHMKGMAADIIVNDVNVSEICALAESVGFTGIGMYDGGYVHVDTRPTKYFWRNNGNNRIETFGGEPIEDKIEVPTNATVLANDIMNVLKKHGYA